MNSGVLNGTLSQLYGVSLSMRDPDHTMLLAT